jgi:hypothetical protein
MWVFVAGYCRFWVYGEMPQRGFREKQKVAGGEERLEKGSTQKPKSR